MNEVERKKIENDNKNYRYYHNLIQLKSVHSVPSNILSLGQFYQIWQKIVGFLRQNHQLWLKMG